MSYSSVGASAGGRRGCKVLGKGGKVAPVAGCASLLDLPRPWVVHPTTPSLFALSTEPRAEDSTAKNCPIYCEKWRK